MANRKMYEIAFHLGGKVMNSYTKAMNKAPKDIKKLNKRIQKTSSYANRASKNISKIGKVAKTAAVAVVAAFSVRAIVNVTNRLADAAREQILNEKRLETVLKQRTLATDDQINSIVELTSVQEKLGVVEGEVQLAGAQQLATFVSSTDTVNTLIPAMNNLLAQQKGLNATSSDAVNIGNLMGKVLLGQTGALTRVGITFDDAQEKVLKYGTESERAAMLAQVITDNVGEMNKTLAQTDDGKILQAKIMFGDIEETLGRKIIPLQAKFAGFFIKNMPKIERITMLTINKLSNGLQILKNVGVKAFIAIKTAIVNNRPTINTFKNNLLKLKDIIIEFKDIAIKTFQNIKKKIEENKPTIERVKTTIADLSSVITNVLVKAFIILKPTLEWLRDKGLPGVVDGLAKTADGAVKVYNFFKKYWKIISPIVAGVAGSIAFCKGVMIGQTIATKAMTLATVVHTKVTGALTAAQTMLNFAFSQTPIGWIVLGIGLIIAAGVALYQNWDKVKATAISLWNKVKKVFGNIRDFVGETIDTVKDKIIGGIDTIRSKFKGFLNFIETSGKSIGNFFINPLNSVIDGINSIEVKIPKWVPKYGGKKFGFDIENIPMLAKGTSNFAGGLAVVGEQGRELVNMPKGSQVTPNRRTEKILNGMEQSSSQVNVTYAPNIVIQGSADKEEIMEATRMSFNEFKNMMKLYLKDNSRVQFS